VEDSDIDVMIMLAECKPSIESEIDDLVFDIDVMIMLAECKPSIESEIDDLVFDINLKYDCLIVPLYFGEDELESGPLSEAPVYKRILSEGIQL